MWLAGFALLMLVLTITPAPTAHSSLQEILPPQTVRHVLHSALGRIFHFAH
jgi:hypothetical protein